MNLRTRPPISRVCRAIAEAIRPDPQVWVDQWAESNRVLPPDVPEPGQYRNKRTPYLIDVQRTMSPSSRWREGWWMKPHQVGGSVSGENMIGAWICTGAGSILVVFPTLDDGKQWEQARFEPMRASTRALRRRIPPAEAKGSGNTKLRKKYPGGVMRLIGANRVGGMKSSTIRYIKYEEPDEYVKAIGGQGRPIDIIRKRADNFGRKAKIYGDGTPTVDGDSAIQAEVLRGDQRKWHLRCPDCGHAQVLHRTQLKWTEGDPDSVRLGCLSCGVLSTEAEWKRCYAPRPRGTMSEAEAKAAGLAYWEATAIGLPGVASWTSFSSLAAPLGWRPWPHFVREWLAAQGDEEKLRTFANNYDGECYTDTLRTEVGVEALRKRAWAYQPMTCPRGGLVVTAGVDTQDNRIAVVIRAFGRGEQSWGVWHSEIYGDTTQPEVWGKLAELLNAPIRHESGQVMHVDAAAIDCGGHRREEVLAFCREAQLRGKHWFAIAGAKAYDAPKLGKPKPADFTYQGRPVPGGGVMRFLGTQSIKNLINGRFNIPQPGDGYYHFPLAFEEDYYKQLRSERQEWRRDGKGHRALWWVQGKGRNEAWDCEVYCYAAFLYAMSGRHAEAVWREREKLYGVVLQLDLLDPAAVQAPAPLPSADRGAEGSDDGPAPAAELEAAEAEELTAASPATQLIQRRRRPPARRNGFATNWGR